MTRGCLSNQCSRDRGCQRLLGCQVRDGVHLVRIPPPSMQGYQGFVMVFADLKMLAAGSVFVGTYSSNVSRLVALLREGIHGHARGSCISLDKTEFGLQY